MDSLSFLLWQVENVPRGAFFVVNVQAPEFLIFCHDLALHPFTGSDPL